MLRKLETKIWDQIRGKERNYIVYLLSKLLIVQRGIQPGLTETENHKIIEGEETDGGKRRRRGKRRSDPDFKSKKMKKDDGPSP